MASSDARRRRVGAVALLSALAVATTAFAVDVRGSLRIPDGLLKPDTATNEPPYKPYWEEWNGLLDLRTRGVEPSRQLAVILTGNATGTTTCTHAFKGGDLAPSTLVVKTGGTLRVENRDVLAHELFAEGLEALAPLSTAPGNARITSIDKPGSWSIRDRLYPHVRGHLHSIADLVACAELDDQGRFRFPEVAPGTYTLKVLRGADTLLSKEVQIADGRTQSLDPVDLSASSK